MEESFKRDVGATYERILDEGPPRFHLSELVVIDEMKKCLCQPLLDAKEGKSVDECLAYLEKFNSPPVRCGRVFLDGEPTYTCADCGVDPTCVLCHACFVKSGHSAHAYSVNMSQGGGCCDCGDPEAWKGSAYCEIHKQCDVEPSAVDALRKQSEAVQKQLFDVVKFILVDGHSNLRATAADALSSTIPVRTKKYAAMLYNDEVHSFNDVIGQLRKAIRSDDNLGRVIANFVDVEGRACVCVGSEQDCRSAADTLAEIHLESSCTPLVQIATEEVFVALMGLVGELSRRIDCVRACVCGVLLGLTLEQILSRNLVDNEKPLISVYLTTMCNHWKSARAGMRSAIFGSILLESDYKLELSKQYSRHYGDIMDHFADDDQHGESLGQLSVQLFTVPSICKELVAHHNIVRNIINFVLSHTRTVAGDTRMDCTQQLPQTATRAIADLIYCFKNEMGDISYVFQEIVPLLKRMQYMNPIGRKQGEHVAFESNSWLAAFQITSTVSRMMENMLKPDSLDTTGRREIALMLLASLCEEESVRQVLGNVSGIEPDEPLIPKFAVGVSDTSFHCIIQRTITRLLLSIRPEGDPLSFRDIFSAAATTAKKSTQIACLTFLEPSLRCWVMSCQIKGNYWVRNGLSVLNQISNYSGARLRWWMETADLATMQVATCVLGAGLSLKVILDRFGLKKWFDDVPNPRFDDLEALMVPQFWNTLVQLYQSRLLKGVGMCTEEEYITLEVVYALACGPLPFSSIAQCVETYTRADSSVSKIVKKVAERVDLEDTSVYKLKDDALEMANNRLHYALYSGRDADPTYVTGRLKRKHPKKLFFPPTINVDFAPAFEPLYRLPQHPFVYNLAIQTLIYYLAGDKNKRSATVSRDSLEMMLHLLAVRVNEAVIKDDTDAIEVIARHIAEKQHRNKTLLVLFSELLRCERCPEEIKAGVEWLLQECLKRAPEDIKELFSATGIVEAKEVKSGKRKQKGKNLAAKKKKAMKDRFAKMNVAFEALLDDDSDDDRENSAKADQAEDDADLTVSCIYCQEEGNCRTEDFVVLGLVMNGGVLVKSTRQSYAVHAPHGAKASKPPPKPKGTSTSTSFTARGRPEFDIDDDDDDDDADGGNGNSNGDDADGEYIEIDAIALDEDDDEDVEADAAENLLNHQLQNLEALEQALEQQEANANANANDNALGILGMLLRRARENVGVRERSSSSRSSTKHPVSSHMQCAWSKKPEACFKCCGHHMHLACFKNFLGHQVAQFRHGIPKNFHFSCPMCRAPSNLALPYTHKIISSTPPRDAFASPMHEMKTVLARLDDSRDIRAQVNEVPVASVEFEVKTLLRDQPINRNLPGAPFEKVNFLYYTASVMKSHDSLEWSNDNLCLWNLFGQTLSSLELADRFHEDNLPVAKNNILGIKTLLSYLLKCSESCALPQAFQSIDDILFSEKTFFDPGDSLALFLMLMCGSIDVSAVTTGALGAALSRGQHHEDGAFMSAPPSMAMAAPSSAPPTRGPPCRPDHSSSALSAVATKADALQPSAADMCTLPVGAGVVVSLAYTVTRVIVLAARGGLTKAAKVDELMMLAKEQSNNIPEEELRCAIDCIREFRDAHGIDTLSDDKNLLEAVAYEVLMQCATLCRQAVIVDSAIKNVPVATLIPRSVDSCLATLSLPPFAVLMRSFYADDVTGAWRGAIAKWIANFSAAAPPRLLMPDVNHTLLELPVAYNELVVQSCNKKCKSTGLPMKDPAMCLLCGDFVCFHSPCCSKTIAGKEYGGCTQHAKECSGGLGIFLLIKHGAIVAISDKDEGVITKCPYFDEHGEPDPGLRRSCHLLLNEKKYNAIKQQWRDHAIRLSFDPRHDRPGRWVAM